MYSLRLAAQPHLHANSGYSGPDSFTFKANDGSTDSNIATVSITVISTYLPSEVGDQGYINSTALTTHTTGPLLQSVRQHW